ncbi:MAG: DUF2075 domain-containing protein [Verrucomicrobia bacterium]|nr:DUF2075 domain-containing protein [Verrucomicrobiota bacterium]
MSNRSFWPPGTGPRPSVDPRPAGSGFLLTQGDWAEKVSAFVRALLDGEEGVARETLEDFRRRYPIRLTREIGKAKEWVRQVARGTERYGMLASSSAHRLKPDAVNVKEAVNAGLAP